MRTIEIARSLTKAQRHEARMLWHHLGNRVALMEAQGCSLAECDRYVGRVLLQLESGRLDEGLLDMLGDALTKFADSSLSQGLKGMLGDKLVAMIGLDRNSFLGGIISNFIENTTASDLIALFQGPGKCNIVATRLAGTLQEQIVEQFITGPLGLEAKSGLGRTIIEAIKAQFVEGGPIVKMVASTICGLKLSDLLPGQQLKQQLQRVSDDWTGAAKSVAGAAKSVAAPLAAPTSVRSAT